MIYLDNAATTKPNIEVLEKASIFNNEKFFNPSALYQGGLDSHKEIDKAKESILRHLGAFNHEVIFTSCGSESDNQAIFCSVKKGSYVTDKGEHSAVYKSFCELKQRGNSVFFVSLNKDGSVNTNELYDYIKNNKVDFVSIVHVNNETGAINDVNEIAKNIKSLNKNIIFHVDGVQAYGKLIYKLLNDIDFYAISSHKINGLKGTGALIKKKNTNIAPLIFGGGQENGLRSGTENIYGIKILEYAGDIRYKNLKENLDKVSKLKKLMLDNLDKKNIFVISEDNSSPYILSVSAIGLRGEIIMHILEQKGIIVGNGSACSSKSPFSRVIEACGYDRKILDGVLRISFSPDNTEDEIIYATNEINNAVKQLKRIIK